MAELVCPASGVIERFSTTWQPKRQHARHRAPIVGRAPSHLYIVSCIHCVRRPMIAVALRFAHKLLWRVRANVARATEGVCARATRLFCGDVVLQALIVRHRRTIAAEPAVGGDVCDVIDRMTLCRTTHYPRRLGGWPPQSSISVLPIAMHSYWRSLRWCHTLEELSSTSVE